MVWLTGAEPQAERPVEPVLGGILWIKRSNLFLIKFLKPPIHPSYQGKS